MRIFITSTPDELETCQMIAVQAVQELGHEPVLRDPVPRLGLDPVTACSRQIARADAVLAIVGFRRARVPSGQLGGDGLRPWTSWELGYGFEHRLPVVALLAGEGFGPERESDPEAVALMSDLRGELARVARVFDDEGSFRTEVEAAIKTVQRQSWTPGVTAGELRLRRFEALELPPTPYPVLLPYTHPDLMAGRDEDLADLRRTLALPLTVVGLHAASGAGKSSLLAGGLVPSLRAEGRPVALERHPTEPGLTSRLLGDLLEGEDPGQPIEVRDARGFVDHLLAVRRLADGATPLLVIDQFEDLLKDGAERTLAELGPLLAASAQRLPGIDGPVCRWLLAYRQEYNGRVMEWLEDVLRQARAVGLSGLETLPHDLSSPRRFVDWPLLPLGAPAAGSGDLLEAASQVFLQAIKKPLSLDTFPWAFAPDHAERLARAFGRARLRSHDAPLAPELQVVLAHLLEQAGEPAPDRPATVTVPEETDELIERALQQHLRRALDRAFPHELDSAARLARTRALLVLRELADEHGRRDQAAHPAAEALGRQGHEILEKLSTPQTRLVLLRRRPDAQVYVLAHDRLAEVVVQVVDEGGWAELEIDGRLLALRRFVALQSRLFASGDAHQATVMAAGKYHGIEAHREVLLWSEAHRAWWRACVERQRADRRRLLLRRTVAAVLVLSVAAMAWFFADQRAQYLAELEMVATGEPEAAFAALGRLTREPDYDAEALLDRLRRRKMPFDVFEKGLGGVEDSERAEALVRIAESALPILDASPEDPVLIASLAWALDFFARDADYVDRALELRNRALAHLRRKHPPPAPPEPDDAHWADIPAGTFWMGAGPDEGRDQPDMQDEYPRHQVTLSAFRMMVHEVSNAEYRRLVPDHKGADDLPAVAMHWFEAYTYAAWLGGRLPTESEWEYAARAECDFLYCKRDGSEATLSEVAWWVGNSTDPETGEPAPRSIMKLEPNPFGLWDMYGNVWEW
ncbi:MAG: SUMF1/EgtB/PvdO family nonheme iron enzyme, partial [Holophagales bacterium]|nr:SUMF1/EgtB/PvdO family nonheme iron enzyme [Holophagales bacterium]